MSRKGFSVLRHAVALLAALCCCWAVLVSLGGCAPKDAAVGNTRTPDTAVTHDSVDRSDITVGVLSAGNVSLDQEVLKSLHDSGLEAVYASQASNESVAQSAVTNMTGLTNRVVSVVVVAGLDEPFEAVRGGSEKASSGEANDVTGAGNANESDHTGDSSKEAVDKAESWNKALGVARTAGTPVVLVNPGSQLPGSMMFAASLHVLDKPVDGSKSLEDALALVINDNPHPHAMNVTL